MRGAITREVLEETGATVTALGELVGTYSSPERDPRFHAVTIVVSATIGEPDATRVNPVEVTEVGLFHDHELPQDFSHGMQDMVDNVVKKAVVWE